MKRIISLSFLFYQFVCVFSQSCINNDSIPMLLEIDKNYKAQKKMMIANSEIFDTLKISSKVIVNFEYPLKDTSSVIEVKSIEIIDLRIYKIKNEKHIFFATYPNKKAMYNNESFVIELVKSKLRYWYRYQPYKLMLGKEFWGNKVALVATFYMIPCKGSIEL
ncbi:hypothetical protein [Bacteroides reticulotermitis]|uniref:hypothetical protein n=1 Tax=Bacteroides reticulotermitis TaxID=1133319 RepID=UPI003A85EFBE